jgi:hypothetical protein
MSLIARSTLRPSPGTVAAGVVLLGALSTLSFQPSGAATSTSTSTTSTTTSTTTVPVTASTTTVPPVKVPLEDPFNVRVVAQYLRSRTDDVTAALYDVSNGKTYLYRPGTPQLTASMVKIDILANLLYLDQLKGKAMSKHDATLATSMIEDSDNKAAQKLWLQIGQLPTSSAFNRLIGFKQTIANWGWGDTETTPRDQLTLLKTILFPNAVLDAASRTFEQNLMENVADGQRFGIPTSVPDGAMVGVKNGWYPETLTGWQINTAGYVHLGHCYYLAVIMTAHNPNETYGLETINQISHMFWNFESRLSKVPTN